MKTPLPEYDDRVTACSPVPIQTILGLVAEIATAPTAAAPTLSEMARHVVPPLLVFHSPPLRVAA